MSTYDLIKKIAEQLPQKLGENFDVLQRYGDPLPEGINIVGDPDVVVINRDTKEMTLIEIKGSALENNLPLAVVPETQRLLESNQEIQDEKVNVILVSTSNVINPIRARLKELAIPLIDSNQEETILTELTSRLRGI